MHVAFSSSSHAQVYLSSMSHLAHAQQTLKSTHHACRLWLMTISCLRPPIMHVAFALAQAHLTLTSTLRPLIMRVAFSSYPSDAHVHPSYMSYLAHAHFTVTSTHHACRIWLMPISRSRPPPIIHVALSSCSSDGHVHPSCMSHLAHAHHTLTSTHHACCI